ncbi:MAG: hypothetical protein MUF71_14955 [Candidatus Kapabacteria bacterium]|jgi:hypothetical protein|nr:hypothetical protein [Candidatus Kapabacteria bacterium]
MQKYCFRLSKLFVAALLLLSEGCNPPNGVDSVQSNFKLVFDTTTTAWHRDWYVRDTYMSVPKEITTSLVVMNDQDSIRYEAFLPKSLLRPAVIAHISDVTYYQSARSSSWSRLLLYPDERDERGFQNCESCSSPSAAHKEKNRSDLYWCYYQFEHISFASLITAPFKARFQVTGLTIFDNLIEIPSRAVVLKIQPSTNGGLSLSWQNESIAQYRYVRILSFSHSPPFSRSYWVKNISGMQNSIELSSSEVSALARSSKEWNISIVSANLKVTNLGSVALIGMSRLEERVQIP